MIATAAHPSALLYGTLPGDAAELDDVAAVVPVTLVPEL